MYLKSKKGWLVLIIAACLVITLLLPACGEEAAPAPTTTAPTTTAPSTIAPTKTTAPSTTAPTAKPTTAAPEKTGKLKLSYTVPKGKTYGKGMDDFAVQFEKATNGRYTVEIYPSNSLVTLTEAWDATIGRKAEIVVSSTGMFATRFLLNNLPSVTTLGWNPQSPEDTQKGWAAWWELINAFPEVKAEFDGVKLLNPQMMDPFFFVSKEKEVHVPADLAGMKVGTSGPFGEIVKANGGATVHQVPPQAYMNMDKGVIDACSFTFGMVNDYSMDEIASYMFVQPMTQVQLVLIMNQEAWNELSASDQKLLESTMRESLKISAQGSWDSQKIGRDRWINAGRKIATPTAAEKALWEEAAVVAIRKWRDDCVEAGYSPELLVKILDKWKEIRKSYGQ